jgi:cytochrome c biogenesis protein CcdA/thiol-disulfide isomerase/thioredoxin
MQTDLVNIGLGFAEGVGLILSPCILPILPIVLAGSLDGSLKRPFGIITGFVTFFALFTFFSRKIVLYSGIDLNIVRHVSYGVLLLLGVVMLSGYLTEKFASLTRKLANTGSTLKSANNSQGGFWSGVLFGALIALIWTPCAGPILAAIIVQTVIQKSNFTSFLTVVAFGLGAGLPMLIIALFGRGIMNRLGFLKTHTSFFRKLLGVIIIASVAYMIYTEGGISVASASKSSDDSTAALGLEKGLAQPYKAPAIDGIVAWINSPPLSLSELKGKVVLIDFWTYSCINCVRTLPYVKDWYDKYHDQGLVIIGVHTPEFDFEKDLKNVEAAVIRDGIKYPVALDSKFVTWQNYKNSYWPAHYLINKDGDVVYTHFGEGDYDVTENNIRFLLGVKSDTPAKADAGVTANPNQTPETYLGYKRAERFHSQEAITKDKTAKYSYPTGDLTNVWALEGSWVIFPDRVVSDSSDSALKFNFNARKVYIVMGNSTGKSIKVKLTLNGSAITSHQGKDLSDSAIDVNSNALYEALILDKAQVGTIELKPESPGLEVYTFTFGE